MSNSGQCFRNQSGEQVYSAVRGRGFCNWLEGKTNAQMKLDPVALRHIRNHTERRQIRRKKPTTQELIKQEYCQEMIASAPEMVFQMVPAIAPERQRVTVRASISCSLSTSLNNQIQIPHVKGTWSNVKQIGPQLPLSTENPRYPSKPHPKPIVWQGD